MNQRSEHGTGRPPIGGGAERADGGSAEAGDVRPVGEDRSDAPGSPGPPPPPPSQSPRPWLVESHVVPPPPRPGERHVRLPRIGIVLSDDELRRSVDRWFHKPMIVLAILILPLLAAEFLLLGKQPQLREGILGLLIPAGLAVIWLAFFIEFVVKITIAESRIEYVRRHWIDVAIIVLPLLRPLRIARVARTARVFTLRGVGLKMARYGFALFLGVEAGEQLAQRIGLRRKGRRDPSRMTRHQLEQEIRRLRRQVDGWEAWFDEHRAHREQFGVDGHFEARERPATATGAADGAADETATGATTDATTDATAEPRAATEASPTSEPTRGASWSGGDETGGSRTPPT